MDDGGDSRAVHWPTISQQNRSGVAGCFLQTKGLKRVRLDSLSNLGIAVDYIIIKEHLWEVFDFWVARKKYGIDIALL